MCFREVRGVTWLRDSHALFDYESTNLVKSAITVMDVSQELVIARSMATNQITVQETGFLEEHVALLKVSVNPTQCKSIHYKSNSVKALSPSPHLTHSIFNFGKSSRP